MPETSPLVARWSRRQFLRVAAAGVVAAAGTGALAELLGGSEARAPAAPRPATPKPVASGGSARIHYVSRPDLTPPPVDVRVAARAEPAVQAQDLVLFTPNNGLAPDRPMIVDAGGEPVWLGPTAGLQTTNLQASTYRGEPVLTWWEGKIASGGLGSGEYVIVDSSYAEVARVRAAYGRTGDLHEFVLSPDGTALFLITNTVDLARPSATGTGLGPTIEAIIQEVDVATGQLVFEWHSLPAIDPSESYLPIPTDGSSYDYLHANSIDISPDGDLLLSARHTWAVYKIDRGTGAVRWRLNGRRSDFRMAAGTAFAWQHDARAHGLERVSIFDDGANGDGPNVEPSSRGIVLDLDLSSMTARLEQAYVHPEGLLASSQGNLQLLPGGGAFVGWGRVPRFSQFDAFGNLVFDASFEVGQQSYRAFRQPWTGRPAEAPAVALTGAGAAQPTLHVSWNGATGVASWEILTGSTPEDLTPGGRVPAVGFETAVRVPIAAAYVVARALDASGMEMGRSRPVATIDAG